MESKMKTREEDENTAKKQKLGLDGSKSNIYVHLVDPFVSLDSEEKVVSMLYKIEIDSENLTLPPPPGIKEFPLIKPVYEFKVTERKYPCGMSFVSIGSQLYFMGGSLSYMPCLLGLNSYRNPSFENTLECFPPDVYVFDCVTSQLLHEDSCFSIPPMNSGKPQDPITFVVDNHIFVLSSRNGPQGMTHFETINPLSKQCREWKKLELPSPDFFSETKVSHGSVVVGRKLFVTYSSEVDPHLLFQYDIDSGLWADYVASCFQPFYSSVFVNHNLYSAVCGPLKNTQEKYNHPVLSFYSMTTTPNIYEFTHMLKNSNRICTTDIETWPEQFERHGKSTRRLLHLGGLLKGTNNNSASLGLVELFKGYNELNNLCVCELHFVVFEAIKGNSSDGMFNARTIHACHLQTGLSNDLHLNDAAACVL